VDRSDFEVVVDFTKVETAERAFDQWLAARGRARDEFAPDDVLVDTGRGSDGDIRRYSIRRSAL